MGRLVWYVVDRLNAGTWREGLQRYGVSRKKRGSIVEGVSYNQAAGVAQKLNEYEEMKRGSDAQR